MLYSFEFITKKLTKTYDIHVIDGPRDYLLTARKGRWRHVFTNIPVVDRPQLVLPLAGELRELSFDSHGFMTAEQHERNRDMLFDGQTYFRREVRGVPKQAIVSFPHFGGHAGFPAPYSLLNAANVDLDDTLYLTFQDPFFVQGSYLLSDNYGNDPKPGIADTIARELGAFGLDERYTTFLGSSKGAAIALIMGQVYRAEQLILCSLTTDLTGPIRNSRYSHLGVALDHFNVEIPDTAELLFNTAIDREVHWLYSTRDPESTLGNEKKTAPMLEKYPFSLPHGEIIGKNFPLIAELIERRQSTLSSDQYQ